MNYRNDARKHLARFNEEFGSRDNDRLKYAALELRMAMEALTYDRALAYKDEFPPSEYETWQPRKLMVVLLDIDPMADKDRSLRYGVEEEYGGPAPTMTSLGSEKVLSMAILKKHYDVLGSYLHIQSMKQVRAGKPLNLDKMRSRCETIGGIIRDVLSSPVFNFTLGSFSALPCTECGNPVRKRLPEEQSEVHAECYECDAAYTLTDRGNGEVEWKPDHTEIECENNDCERKVSVWRRKIAIGNYWICADCKGRNTLDIGVRHEPGG